MIRRCSLLVIFFQLFASFTKAQENAPYTFSNTDINEGLSNNSVTCLLQDNYGFMWMGTYDGLNRYDGYGFKIFRNKWQDSTSLINNHVVAIKENDAHSIWVGTLKGLSIFDYHTLTFCNTHYLPYGQQQPREINSRVREIVTGKDGATYVATEDDGLLFLKKGQSLFLQIPLDHARYNASAICPYKGNLLLLFIKGRGLYLFNPVNNSLRLLTGGINDATKLLYDPGSNTILAGTENGLLVYNSVSGRITVPYRNFAHSNITNLFRDKDNNLWVSTDGDGLGEIQPNGNIIIIKESGHSSGLKSNAVYAVYEDNDQKKWIATLRGGVSILNASPDLFNTVRKEPFAKNTLASNFALSFCEDDKHNIWIGTDGGGLSYWNVQTNTFTSYVHDPDDAHSLSGNYVVSLLHDHKGRLWAASFNGGIDLFDKATNHFIHYPCYDPVKNKYNINLWKLYEDSHHRIWAGSTKDDALFLFNEAKQQFELFDEALTNIHTLYEDAEGSLWAGDYSRLIKIDTAGKKHSYLNIGYPVRAIMEDNNHRLWIGTEGGGLVSYNDATKAVKHYTDVDGLCSNAVLNILKDSEGNLWCSTFNGLAKFNAATHKFTSFYANDGLQSNQFSYNAALKLSDGEFLFGGVRGFNKFRPEAIRKVVVHPPLLITDFKINDVPIENSSYLPAGSTPVDVQSVSVPFNKATLSIAFAGLDYAAPTSLIYSYYLEGWDKSWNLSGKTRVANYSRLYEGNYTLHIRATNADGNWNGNERLIHIRVLPPWYRSWWAYLLYVIAFASAVYLYLKYKQRQTRLEYEMKLTRINAEAEKELTERKISFFTNISHEFRTMLTLIINPMKELMKHADENEKPEEIRTAYKNSRRMLSLVTQLLMFRKADVEEAEMMVSKIDLVHIAREVFDSFAYQAKTKGIHYTFTGESDKLEIYGDYEKIEIALFNLLSNAVKYAPEKGRVAVAVKEGNEKVFVTITDNGQGIPKAEQEKIFRKYHQAHSMESGVRPGFGIGLFLVKSYIDKHHGHISLASEENKGTTFYIELLKGKEHFAGIPIRESKKPDHGLLEDILPEASLQQEQAATTEESLPSDLLSGEKTILLADDDTEIRTYVRKLFATGGYKIIEADNGIKALELIRKHVPDLVILDLTMPGMYGDELCQSIKSDEALSHIPVIMLTAEISSETKLRCVESGADDYITKPFEQELLIARAGNLLKTKSNLQRYFYNEITLRENYQKISGQDKDFLEKCISIVEAHLDDDQFEIKKMADELCMSHSNLYKKIHHISGYSASGFVRFVRLRKAAELFISTRYNVNETAFMVGFNDTKYFRMQFQKLFGMTPSAYIKKYRKTFGTT